MVQELFMRRKVPVSDLWSVGEKGSQLSAVVRGLSLGGVVAVSHELTAVRGLLVKG